MYSTGSHHGRGKNIIFRTQAGRGDYGYRTDGLAASAYLLMSFSPLSEVYIIDVYFIRVEYCLLPETLVASLPEAKWTLITSLGLRSVTDSHKFAVSGSNFRKVFILFAFKSVNSIGKTANGG